MSHLTQWFLHTYGIHVTTASPTNHQSLMAGHGIKSLASILMKHLTGLGHNWPLYCKPAMLVYNSYATPNLDNLGPFEVAIGRKTLLAPRFEYKPRIPITVGQIVYMYNPSGSQLQTGNRKIQCHFVGPLAIYKCISPNQSYSCLWMEYFTP